MVSDVVSEIVKVDSKGRVLIPEGVRDAEGLEPGELLQVVDLGKGVFVLRKLELPSKEEVLKTCREVRREIYRKKVEPWLKEALRSK